MTANSHPPSMKLAEICIVAPNTSARFATRKIVQFHHLQIRLIMDAIIDDAAVFRRWKVTV